MAVELIAKNTKVIEYKIQETSISNTDKLSILCQQNGKEESAIIQIPFNNVRVKYSSYVKEPRMRLEISDMTLKGWKKILLLPPRLLEIEPLVVAYIEVQNDYKGILGKYVDSH